MGGFYGIPRKVKASENMEFRLTYKGRLPAESRKDTRAHDKHRIRKVFHGQLSEPLKYHSILKTVRHEDIANQHKKCGYRFGPIFGKDTGIGISLDILFLRRDQPGGVIHHGGDIDNRIKVLFDALKMPEKCEELCGEKPGDGEDPFLCLLLDDTLITDVSVTTDRLLTPLEGGEAINDVLLVIQVKTRVIDPVQGMAYY